MLYILLLSPTALRKVCIYYGQGCCLREGLVVWPSVLRIFRVAMNS